MFIVLHSPLKDDGSPEILLKLREGLLSLWWITHPRLTHFSRAMVVVDCLLKAHDVIPVPGSPESRENADSWCVRFPSPPLRGCIRRREPSVHDVHERHLLIPSKGEGNGHRTEKFARLLPDRLLRTHDTSTLHRMASRPRAHGCLQDHV